MGAANFVQYQEGADVSEAFSAAVREALYENGSGGYSGTLAEKGGDGYTIIRDFGPLTRDEAISAAYRLTDDYDDSRISDKWGPAGALPVTARTGKTRTVTVTVTLDQVVYGDGSGDTRLRAAVEKAVKLKAGERVAAVVLAAEQKPKRKIIVEATEGKAVTRYYVSGTWGGPSDGYSTQAEARAALVEALKAHPDRGGAAIKKVVAKTIRENGTDALVTGRVETTNRVKAKVTLATADPAAPIVGWVFCGWASS